MRAVNRAEAKRQRKVKEDERKKRQQKLQVLERREDTDSDDDDEEEDNDEVVNDTVRDDLESEDVLIGIRSSLQGSGPFPLHEGEGTSERPVETGRTVCLP